MGAEAIASEGRASGRAVPEPATPEGRAGLAALLARPGLALIALDFDGTLAPIVADPAQARILPAALSAVQALAPAVGTMAVITGRPAMTAGGDGAGHQGARVRRLGHHRRAPWPGRGAVPA